MSEEIKKVTMKSTKKELLETVEQMHQLLKMKGSTMLDPEKIKLKAKTKETLSKAKAIISDDPNTMIHNLKLSINKDLINIAEKIEEESLKYKDLSDAVLIKQSELTEIYGIEEKTSSLAALIESQKVIKQNFENEMNDVKDKWAKEKIQIDEIQIDSLAKMSTERKRENEQFEYNRDRERVIERNKFDDHMEEVKKELRQQEISFSINCQTKAKELEEREESINSQQESIDQLKTQVEGFPEVLRKAEGAVKGKVEARLQKSYEQDTELMKMKFEGEFNVFTSKIETLEALTVEQARQIVKLETIQEKAYKQVQEIANKAVSGASERPQNLTIQSSDQKPK